MITQFNVMPALVGRVLTRSGHTLVEIYQIRWEWEKMVDGKTEPYVAEPSSRVTRTVV